MIPEKSSSKPRLTVDPSRLNKFIDSPSIGNSSRVKHAAEIKAETKIVSWNGEKCDTRAFESRLAPPDQVLLRNDRRARRLLGTDIVPPSMLMVSKHVPVADADDNRSSEQLTAPLMVQREGAARSPQIAHVPVPSSVFLHEQGLLTPAQRRERLDFETKYHAARRAMGQAERDERRLHQIVQARHSTNDVLNMEPHSNVDQRSARGEPYKSSFLSHDMAPKPGLPREYQKKMDRATPHLHTHDRIFNETPVEWSRERAQHLRNEGQAGRPFDIINGGTVQQFPPTVQEKQHVRQSHPSVIIHPYTR